MAWLLGAVLVLWLIGVFTEPGDANDLDSQDMMP
jgi:hypothetical protein